MGCKNNRDVVYKGVKPWTLGTAPKMFYGVTSVRPLFPPMYCDICHVKLCLACVGVHISDQSKEHKVVLFEKRGSTPKCQKHCTKICDLHCEQCNIPICTLCISSGEHEQHKKEDISKTLTVKKEKIQKELEELEKIIFPKYQKAATNIPVQKTDARKHCRKLTAALQKQGEALHKEIDNVIQKMQSEIDAMDSQHLAAIDKQEKEINLAIAEIEKFIAEIKALLDSDDFYFVSQYSSRNAEFRRLPTLFQVTLPTFTPREINREHIYQQLGSLSKLAITTEEHGRSMKTSGAESSPVARRLIDEPLILTDINTEYGDDNRLCSVSCLSDNEFWTRGYDKFLRLYNLQGELLKSIQTKSGNMPRDIAVTQNQDLVYTDKEDRSINIVNDTQIQPLIILREWIPLNLCNTSSGNLLVTMVRNDYKQSKVVRYSGPTEIQSIQWDDQGRALYSSDQKRKYLSENRNLDICVADWTVSAVVVVSAAGKLRFRYTGTPPPTTTTKKPFKPRGITTDSQSRILISDCNNHQIHILDQDGHFLRYIHKTGLKYPVDLCVDSTDNLFVTECISGNVKKIQYSYSK